MPHVRANEELSTLKPFLENSGKEKANKALHEFCSGKRPGPNPSSVSFGKGCYLTAMVSGDKIHIGNIFVHPRERHLGYGSSYLKMLLDVADKYGVTLSCHAEPYGEQNIETKMGKKDLIAWYKRKGFKQVPYYLGYFVREPGAKISIRPEVAVPQVCSEA